MEIDTGNHKLTGLGRINVVLGKNGCGKSTLLKEVNRTVRSNPDQWGAAKYITPERGGILIFDPNIEPSARNSPDWIASVTEKNQYSQFKQQTFYQFERLQLTVLQNIAEAVENSQTPEKRTYMGEINSLLDNIEIREQPKGGKGFKVHIRSSGAEVASEQISSGESELISLAIECLAFAHGIVPSKFNLLVLDEPDVHLHPDLQGRLMRFLNDIVMRNPSMYILMATHSTAILGELSRYEHTYVAPMVADQRELEFESIDEVYRQILPVFGAHPLTSVFREHPLMIVEGTDEERIWQQAIRTSEGKIHFYPVNTNGLSEMSRYEKRAIKVTTAVYDGATFYSLRDRDKGNDTIVDEPPLVRLKLSCRASENLLLSNEVLVHAGTNWEEMQTRFGDWLATNPGHQKEEIMKSFVDGGFERKSFDLKELRIIVVYLMGSNKPWEVLVGQAIGNLTTEELTLDDEGSLVNFMGSKLTSVLASLIPA